MKKQITKKNLYKIPTVDSISLQLVTAEPYILPGMTAYYKLDLVQFLHIITDYK